MPKTDLPPLVWDGFPEPNFTPVPDAFFDVLLPYLSDAEVRVLLYLIRRTYGFKKRSDAVSLSQITHGITKADGTILDRGAGISRGGAQRALTGLIAKGVITATHNRSARYGDQATTYTVRVSQGPSTEYRGATDGAGAVSSAPPAPGSVHGPQETDGQDTGRQGEEPPRLATGETLAEWNTRYLERNRR
jgi:hypothetical protein